MVGTSSTNERIAREAHRAMLWPPWEQPETEARRAGGGHGPVHAGLTRIPRQPLRRSPTRVLTARRLHDAGALHLPPCAPPPRDHKRASRARSTPQAQAPPTLTSLSGISRPLR